TRADHPTVVTGIHGKRYGDVRRNVFIWLSRVFPGLQEHGSERYPDAAERLFSNDHGHGKKSMGIHNEPAEVKCVVEGIAQHVVLFLRVYCREVAQGDGQKTYTAKISCRHSKAFYLILSSRQNDWCLSIIAYEIFNRS